MKRLRASLAIMILNFALIRTAKRLQNIDRKGITLNKQFVHIREQRDAIVRALKENQ